MQDGRFGAVTRYAELAVQARPCGRGLVLRLLRAAAGVLHIGGALHWFQLLGADDLAGRGLVVLRIGWTPEGPVYRRSLWVLHIAGTTVWCGLSGELRPGAEYREEYRSIGNKGWCRAGGTPGAWGASHRFRPLDVIGDNGSCCALRKVPENVAL